MIKGGHFVVWSVIAKWVLIKEKWINTFELLNDNRLEPCKYRRICLITYIFMDFEIIEKI